MSQQRTAVDRLLTNEPIALLVAFLLLVTGAGGLADRYVDPSSSLLRKTTRASERAGSYRFTTSQRYEGSFAKASTIPSGVRLSGAVDVDAGRSRFDTAIKLPGISVSCTNITSGDDLFISVHPSRRRDIGASWLRTDIEGPLASTSVQGVRPDELNANAAELFKALDEDGSAVVRGVRTSRYSGMVDIAALAGSSVASGALNRFGRTLPVAVYIDDDDLLRRITITVTSGPDLKVTVTTDLYDFGKPVEITVPSSAVKQASRQEFALACYPKQLAGGGSRTQPP